MKNYNNILIIPDVHGRPAWKQSCASFIEKHKASDAQSLIIFLGDYHDPYVSIDMITPEMSYNNLKEIFAFYDENHNAYDNIDIIMLFGNHDIHYIVESDYCRLDRARSQELEQLYKKYIYNIHLLPCYPCLHNDEKIIFSHAGLTKHFVCDLLPNVRNYKKEKPFENIITDKNNIDFFAVAEKLYNYWVEVPDMTFIDNFLYMAQTCIGTSRGGFDRGGGSLIWADVYDHFIGEPVYNKDVLQIFGHTYAKQQVRDDDYKIWMVDTGCSMSVMGSVVEI